VACSVLTEVDVIAIRARAAGRGLSALVPVIAQDYRVSEATIRNVVKRRTWRHI
jgi:hypothetical protein